MISSSWPMPQTVKAEGKLFYTPQHDASIYPSYEPHAFAEHPKLPIPLPSIHNEYPIPEYFEKSDDPLVDFSCSPYIPDLLNPVLYAYNQINSYLSSKDFKDECLHKSYNSEGIILRHIKDYSSLDDTYEATQLVVVNAGMTNILHFGFPNNKAITKYFGVPLIKDPYDINLSIKFKNEYTQDNFVLWSKSMNICLSVITFNPDMI